MSEPTIESIAPGKIAEVRAFLKAKKAVDELLAAHPEMASQLRALIPVHNATLAAADEVVRGKRISCGPWTLKHFASRIHADALAQLVGRSEFVKMGGIVETKTTFAIDKARFEGLVARRELAPALVAQVVVRTPHYEAPKAIVLP